jgi:hypothetical protein
MSQCYFYNFISGFGRETIEQAKGAVMEVVVQDFLILIFNFAQVLILALWTERYFVLLVLMGDIQDVISRSS